MERKTVGFAQWDPHSEVVRNTALGSRGAGAAASVMFELRMRGLQKR